MDINYFIILIRIIHKFLRNTYIHISYLFLNYKSNIIIILTRQLQLQPQIATCYMLVFQNKDYDFYWLLHNLIFFPNHVDWENRKGLRNPDFPETYQNLFFIIYIDPTFEKLQLYMPPRSFLLFTHFENQNIEIFNKKEMLKKKKKKKNHSDWHDSFFYKKNWLIVFLLEKNIIDK